MSYTRPDGEWVVADFKAGWLDAPPPERLVEGATPDARNCWFEHFGPGQATLAKRPGATCLTPTALASAAVTTVAEFTREGTTPQLVAVCNGTASVVDTATGIVAPIGDATGFSATRPTRAVPWKDFLILLDGTTMKRCTPSIAYSVGFAKPTGAPTLSFATGPGVTGTYEGYAVWYDSVADHESSPSVYSNQVGCSNQARLWTKPSGTPPAHVTHWRVYCRRVDTYELNFYRVATVEVATSTVTEAISDLARTDLGPPDSVNDPPPAFALLTVHRGYGIAARLDGGQIYVSRVNDLEAWHPKDVFPVGRDGEAITAIKRFGRDVLIFKATSTYRLVGEKPPFAIEQVHSQWGAASQEAVLEVDGRLVAWDPERGPYWTDTSQWVSLSEGRLRLTDVVGTDAWRIHAVHDVTHSLVLFLVPVRTATNVIAPRQILAYHYLLDGWLPPITGLAYRCATIYRMPTTNDPVVIVGDDYGRVYRYFTGTTEGVSAGTLSSEVTGATPTTLTCANATFTTAGSGLAGLPVGLWSPSGGYQSRRILSNTATVLTLDTVNDGTLAPLPDLSGGGGGEAGGMAGVPLAWRAVVGPIEWYWWSPIVDLGNPTTRKRAGWLMLQLGSQNTTHIVDVDLRFDESAGIGVSKDYTVPAAGAVWGTAVWGQSFFGTAGGRATRKARIHRAFHTFQLRLRNYEPDQPVYVSSLRMGVDLLVRRKVASRG